MDLSKLSTDDLMALKGGDLSKVSTDGLHFLNRAKIADQIDNDPISQGAKDPTAGMSGMDKFNAGAGKAFSDLGLGIKQRLGMASYGDAAESRKLDAPLMKAGAAKAGNIGANLAMIAPTALLPGASTVPAAAAIGGMVGVLQPSTSATETALNTGLGAAGGAGGQWIANKAAGSVAFQQGQNAIKAAQGEQKVAAARSAQEAGYVIPPEDLANSGLFTKVMSGIGGKIKTAQVASEKNQSVTNALARKALGLADDEPLTAQALATLRNSAGDAYNVVKGTGTVTADATLGKTLDDIAQKYTTASQSFPGAVKSEVPGMVAALKQPTFTADGAVEMTKILRQQADAAFAGGDKGLGKAMKESADALEEQLGRHLTAQNMPEALKAFQDARALIAKTYTVGKALNTSTGDVSAQALAKALAKGKPLTSELRTIADAGQAFPKATQALKEDPKTFSPLDMAMAAIKSDPTALLTLGARPAARSLMLSGPMQRSALEGAAQPVQANAVARLLSQDYLTIPGGIASGVGAGNALSRYLAQ
jgi:hypothetical protein